MKKDHPIVLISAAIAMAGMLVTLLWIDIDSTFKAIISGLILVLFLIVVLTILVSSVVFTEWWDRRKYERIILKHQDLLSRQISLARNLGVMFKSYWDTLTVYREEFALRTAAGGGPDHYIVNPALLRAAENTLLFEWRRLERLTNLMDPTKAEHNRSTMTTSMLCHMLHEMVGCMNAVREILTALVEDLHDLRQVEPSQNAKDRHIMFCRRFSALREGMQAHSDEISRLTGEDMGSPIRDIPNL